MNHAIVSTIAADLGNTVLFPALATGGCLHVISQARAQDGAALAEYFERESIDVLKIVPSHLAALQSGRSPQALMPARRLVLGGEASRLDWIARLRAAAPNCRIFNHYGPTEATVGVLTYRVEGELPATTTGRASAGQAAAGELGVPPRRVGRTGEGGRPGRDLHRRRRRRARLPRAARSSLPSASCATALRPRTARACIAPAILRASCPTAASSSAAASTTR